MELRPLNIFQRVMRVWEGSHPYNAAQILHLQGPPDIARITMMWNEVLAASGLGDACIRGRRFCYQPAPRQDVAVVEGPLDDFITRELNRPFVDAKQPRATCTSMPFRPFVRPGGDSHHLGVIYQHWVADSVSLRMLLREWFCRLHDPARVSAAPLQVPHGGFWRYFGPRRGTWNLLTGAISTVRSTLRFSRARRLADANDDQQVACSLHHLPDGMIDALLDAARRRKVTLNDLFLAALARACDQHGAAPRQTSQDLALGSIVDLRATCSENLETTFGLFLGFTAVLVPAALLSDPDRLLENIAAQNARQKQCHAAQVSMLRMAAGYTQAKFMTARRLAAFYRNYMPLSGGVSNVNMNRSWAAPYHPAPLLDYLRVAPTGPMVPLVIAVTTIGKRFSFFLTRRACLVDEASGARLAEAFIRELTARAKAG